MKKINYLLGFLLLATSSLWSALPDWAHQQLQPAPTPPPLTVTPQPRPTIQQPIQRRAIPTGLAGQIQAQPQLRPVSRQQRQPAASSNPLANDPRFIAQRKAIQPDDDEEEEEEWSEGGAADPAASTQKTTSTRAGKSPGAIRLPKSINVPEHLSKRPTPQNDGDDGWGELEKKKTPPPAQPKQEKKPPLRFTKKALADKQKELGAIFKPRTTPVAQPPQAVQPMPQGRAIPAAPPMALQPAPQAPPIRLQPAPKAPPLSPRYAPAPQAPPMRLTPQTTPKPVVQQKTQRPAAISRPAIIPSPGIQPLPTPAQYQASMYIHDFKTNLKNINNIRRIYATMILGKVLGAREMLRYQIDPRLKQIVIKNKNDINKLPIMDQEIVSDAVSYLQKKIPANYNVQQRADIYAKEYAKVRPLIKGRGLRCPTCTDGGLPKNI